MVLDVFWKEWRRRPPAVPDPSDDDGSAAPGDERLSGRPPGLDVLALNAAGVTALTALWSGLPDEFKANAFRWSFILFGLGVITAVVSIAAQFGLNLLPPERPKPVASPSQQPPPAVKVAPPPKGN